MSTTVVIMAGGRGLRLHPLTEHLPKPMLHVGERPILQQILEGFTEQGFTRFIFCLGYRAEVIRSHFSDGSMWGAEIAYVTETQPLGTAGALRLIEPEPTVIVQNADVLTRVDYRDVLRLHMQTQADATICAAHYQHQIPYGVLEIEDETLTATLEKPVKSWPVNAGIYVLSRKALEMVPEGYSDMPDLIDRLDRVSVYQIANHWTDVGTLESLERAREGAA